MKKIEYIWRDLLYKAIEEKKPRFQMNEMAKKFGMSTSLVNHALIPLRDLHMIEVRKTSSMITNAEKLLLFWATRRNLQKDIIYETYSSLPVLERETLMPSDVHPTAYSAYRMYFDDAPSDYDVVYYYAPGPDSTKERFPPFQKHQHNIIILQEDRFFRVYPQTTLAQIFVDLWNLKEWYAQPFIDELLKDMRIERFDCQSIRRSDLF